ncbi:MAG TPA: alpha/beta fold hydrolase [Solirubrobacteraceae bacterium]|jgi:pimeloyl-ACP methyl ester carboxylesterase
MRSPARTLALALLASIAGTGLCATPSGAQIAFAPCKNSNNFGCAHLTVPLDRSGAMPGTIALAIRRHLAPVGNARSAVIALAGGPGQSAIPFADTFSEILGSILSTRDLIVYDQRGTGLSHPLSCHGLEQPHAYHSAGALIGACAGQIGPERAFYTTPDSVADIEAIRRAGDYEKLVLYGTSYGTKVALEYAQQYPEHVEALILDSTVTPAGPEPLGRPTFAAVPRILRQLCAFHGCAQITANPVRDLSRLVSRMRRGPVIGRVIDGRGRPHRIGISSNDLIELLVAGDFDPILRAEFIAAVRGAIDNDDAALARLLARAQSGGEESGEDFDVPLYLATSCEEQAFPWSRSASPSERLAQAIARLHALPAGVFAPFTAANALAFSDIRACAYWPFATPAPPVESAPLPNVPTLILSGAEDLRTPTSGAQAIKAQIPDAHLLVVPNTGHSVLSHASATCARRALHAQFADKPIVPCPPTPPLPFLKPTPLPPRRLSALAPAHGYSGRAGRTLQAVKLTVADFGRQFLLQLLETLGSGNSLNLESLRSGGLRAGWAQVAGGSLSFHDYTYVPGVSLTGIVKTESAKLQIGGSAAAKGTLRLGPHHELVGELGGRHVRLAGIGAGGSSEGSPSALGTSVARRDSIDRRLRTSLAAVRRLFDPLPAGFDGALSALPELLPARTAAAL